MSQKLVTFSTKEFSLEVCRNRFLKQHPNAHAGVLFRIVCRTSLIEKADRLLVFGQLLINHLFTEQADRLAL